MPAPFQYEYLWDAANATGDERYARGSTKVWYTRPASFADFLMGKRGLERRGLPLPTLATIEETHVLVGTVDERNPDQVWEMMQGEFWSPHGEARNLIRKLGLSHTSMSVGDIVQVGTTLSMVDNYGFERLATSSVEAAFLHSRVVRLAYTRPDLRPHLLPLLRVAREERGPGGLIFSLDDGFSLRTTPTDPPYNQTYEGLILMESGPKRPYRAALDVIRQNRDEIFRMKKPYEVRRFIDEKVQAAVGRTPKWHTYYMPD